MALWPLNRGWEGLVIKLWFTKERESRRVMVHHYNCLTWPPPQLECHTCCYTVDNTRAGEILQTTSRHILLPNIKSIVWHLGADLSDWFFSHLLRLLDKTDPLCLSPLLNRGPSLVLQEVTMCYNDWAKSDISNTDNRMKAYRFKFFEICLKQHWHVHTTPKVMEDQIHSLCKMHCVCMFPCWVVVNGWQHRRDISC